MKAQLLKRYVEVYELENDSGYLCKTKSGQWVILDAKGKRGKRMNAEQAKEIARSMELFGWNVMLKMSAGKWIVKAIDAGSGEEVTIRTPAEWEEMKPIPVAVLAGVAVQGVLL